MTWEGVRLFQTVNSWWRQIHTDRSFKGPRPWPFQRVTLSSSGPPSPCSPYTTVSAPLSSQSHLIKDQCVIRNKLKSIVLACRVSGQIATSRQNVLYEPGHCEGRCHILCSTHTFLQCTALLYGTRSFAVVCYSWLWGTMVFVKACAHNTKGPGLGINLKEDWKPKDSLKMNLYLQVGISAVKNK